MPNEVRYLSVANVIALYGETMDAYSVPKAALVRPEALESAVQRPRMAGYYAGATLVEQAVALATGIALAHPWVDGNKRCAFASMVVFLEWNGVSVPDPDSITFLATAKMLESAVAASGEGREQETQRLIDELNRWADVREAADHSK
jgi:death-on-curing protein